MSSTTHRSGDGRHFVPYHYNQLTSGKASANQYVFWKGTDGSLFEKFYVNGAWSGLTNLGMGPLGSAPTAGVDANGNTYVFWQGTDNTLREAYWTGTHWFGPINLGSGPLGSAPTVAVTSASAD